MKQLFKKHLSQKLSEIQKILSEREIDCLYIESGYPSYYFLDDQPTAFRPNPHFLYLCPDMGPGHILKIELGVDKPKLFFNIPNDFWHETSSLGDHFWEDCFELDIVSDYKKTWADIVDTGQSNVVISPAPKVALENFCAPADNELISQLHWLRIKKTDYEISCLDQANKKASLGHLAAKALFYNGGSELEVHNAYLAASEQRETELPYGNIVAFNNNTAILHYQFPKTKPNGKTFLIDAGARFNGYCSDITRTYCQENVDERFKALLSFIENSQKLQCEMVRPGVNYVDIHRQANQDVAIALTDTKILLCSRDEAIEKGLTFPFFPHGVGHPLGLQVHDVCGKQISADGDLASQPEDFPHLRTLRTIEENDVLTIEPGLYFIPMLLEELKKDSTKASLVDWNAIEDLIPLGGIRIEDNIVARATTSQNLTRTYLP